jgi:hypothetical protein
VIRDIKGFCQGVHLMAIGLEAEVPAILRQAGLRRAANEVAAFS